LLRRGWLLEDDDEYEYEEAAPTTHCLVFGKDAAYRQLRCPD
jgi:hypothetical protein